MIITDNLAPILKGFDLSVVSVQEEERIGKMLACFETLRIGTSYMMIETVEMTYKQHSSYLCLLRITDTIKPERSPLATEEIIDFEMMGLAILKKDYGRVYIKPETLTDRFFNFFTKTDVDFDIDPEFSKKYYVVCNDADNLRHKITSGFLQTMKEYNGLEIEIEGRVMIVRLRKSFTVENGLINPKFIGEINNGDN